MALLQDNLNALVTQIGTDMGLVKDDIAAALAAIAALPSVASLINDAAGAGVTDKTWSADKLVSEFAATIAAAVAQVKTEIVDGAPIAYDTLLEIANYISTDQTQAAAILLALDNRVRFDAAQTLSAAEQEQAQANIGVTGAGLLAAYIAARDA